MIFSCVSQVNIHAGKAASLGVALAKSERTSGQQQQDRRNDKKQFFHRRYNTSILNEISITVKRNSRSGAPYPQSGSPRKRASLVCSPWFPHFRWRAAVKAQPVRTLAGSAGDASASAGLDCGQPAEYVPRKGSKTVKVVSARDGESLYRAVRFIADYSPIHG